MAADKTAAARTGAVIVFVDESGLSLLPPRRHTWAPAGRTPVVRMVMGPRPKVAMTGWCCYPPRGQGRYFFRIVRGPVTDRVLMRHLRQVHQELGHPLLVVWDNLGCHRSRRMRDFTHHTAWLTVVQLPAYAPDLNPVEGSWAHLKNGPLADLGARTLDELLAVARRGLRRIQHRPALLAGFLTATGLTPVARLST